MLAVAVPQAICAADIEMPVAFTEEIHRPARHIERKPRGTAVRLRPYQAFEGRMETVDEVREFPLQSNSP
jgi:hypothetical protein